MTGRRIPGGSLVLAAVLVVLAVLALPAAVGQRQDDPLPSWNDGGTKQQIVEFVRSVTQPGNAVFVPPEERIATFDNDGTLWVEKPTYSRSISS